MSNQRTVTIPLEEWEKTQEELKNLKTLIETEGSLVEINRTWEIGNHELHLYKSVDPALKKLQEEHQMHIKEREDAHQKKLDRMQERKDYWEKECISLIKWRKEFRKSFFYSLLKSLKLIP